ncbi:MAG: hypothetical protein JW990_00220 [Thermoleophilia bacterium]|nr:hypothetical protein [Thermoleophilia bacterium]
MKSRRRHTVKYPAEELQWRPIEHTIELLSRRKLGAIIHCGHERADLIIHNPRELTRDEKSCLEEWLALCALAGMVIQDKRAPASANSRGAATLERAEVCG